MSHPDPVMALFHDVVDTVPAYAQFLREQGVDPAAVHDRSAVPLMTKVGYHQRYPLPERCREGRLDRAVAVALSSGSSGSPTVWPRASRDEQAVAARFEQVFRDGFGAAERTTLAVVCFALGNWVGGMYTVTACHRLSAAGYPITVATPGNDVEEILRVVDELGGMYDQTVLLGYPPFVKNVIDAGLAQGTDWPSRHVKLVLAGETFSEQWRDLVAQRVGIDDPVTGIASLYGTADAGVLGNETPLSVRIRRFAAEHPDFAASLFGSPRLPTLVQFDPADRQFETTPAGTLLFSADGTVPLVRYHIADEGGVLTHDAMMRHCRDVGFDAGPGPELPFVYVFGRSLFTVSFFGANLYPENIAASLEQPHVSDWTTGRFVLQTVEDVDRDRRLSVVVELAPGVAPTAEREHLAAEAIRSSLLRLNSEFAHYVPVGYQTPQVVLRQAGDPEHFPPGVKHKYTHIPALG